MEKPKLIYSLFFLLTLSISAIVWVNGTNWVYVYLSLILITGFLFIILNRAFGFLLLIIEVLIVGFYITYEAYRSELTALEQIPVVYNHVLFVISLTLLWIIFYILKRDAENFTRMKAGLNELKRFEPQTNVFTKREFMEKTKVIWTGMKRRNEEGFIIFISVNGTSEYTKRAMAKTIGYTLLESVRGDYDVVGKYDEITFIVLLQNTDEKGKSIVLNRFKKALSKEVNVKSLPYLITEQEMNDEFLSSELNQGEAL